MHRIGCNDKERLERSLFFGGSGSQAKDLRQLTPRLE